MADPTQTTRNVHDGANPAAGNSHAAQPKQLGSPTTKPKVGSGPSPKAAPTLTDTRKAIVQTSLAAAQHWFERGVDALKRADSDAARKAIVDRTVDHALPYLEEALLTLPKHDQAYRTKAIVAQTDETSRACITFLSMLFTNGFERERTAVLAVLDIKLRDALQLSKQPPNPFGGAKKPATKNDDALEADALEPVLHLIQLKSEELHRRLLEKGDRFKLVWPYVSAVEVHVTHARSLLKQYSGKDENRRFAGKVEIATLSILRVQHWIDSQPWEARDAAEKVLEQADPGNVDHSDAMSRLAELANVLRGDVRLKPLPKSAPRQDAGKRDKPAIASPPKADHEPAAGKAPHASTQEVDDATLNAESQVQQAIRLAAIQQYALAVDSGFDAVKTGLDVAIDACLAPERLKESSAWKALVSASVGVAIAGAGGFLAGWLGTAIASKLTEGKNEDNANGGQGISGAVQEMIQQAVTDALTPASESAPSSLNDVKGAFKLSALTQFLARKTRFKLQWAELAMRLYRMSPGRVKEFSQEQLAGATWKKLIDDSARQTMIAWSNFIARAMHGSAFADPWDKQPTDLRLKGANRDPDFRGNVDPKRMDWALMDDQRPMQREHFGLLEIHLWFDGTLVDHPGYGMRLDNVGPEVRANFQNAGLVQALPINKVIRFYDPLHPGSPPKPVLGYSFLITADGYVRRGTRKGSEAVRHAAEKAQLLSLKHLTL